MKSVGEAMAIGTTFKESIQKALCSLETGLTGFDEMSGETELIKKEIRRPNADRLLYVAEGFRRGLSIEDIFALSKIDPWFLGEIKEVIDFEKKITTSLLSDKTALFEAKSMGFSDKRLAKLAGVTEGDVKEARNRKGVTLTYNEVDTCAAEFRALTPYLYSTYEKNPYAKNETLFKNDKKVMIIGGGPNRIGQGIEFDYCCVHAAFALKDLGIRSIMLNCNPETVSTDYDTSDILFFEPIDFERVSSIIDKESPDGIIVHFGGQTPLKLSKKISAYGGQIIGTSAETIDVAEDRKLFSEFADRIGLLQPKNATAVSIDEAAKYANEIGYPVLVRPSFVLGGRAMRTVDSEEELRSYMAEAISVSHNSPVLIDKFLDGAIELDADAICDGVDVYVGGIMQHIEEAGIHSGDSACSLPPVSLSDEMIKEVRATTAKIAMSLGVKGLVNIQFAIFEEKLYLIEVNPRASRTVPFVSKATGVPMAKVATRVMWQGNLREALSFYDKHEVIYEEDGILLPRLKGHIAVKEAVFPFNKLAGSDVSLGPEMKSTGEVMGISCDFGISFAKSQAAAGNRLPKGGKLFISLSQADKVHAITLAKEYSALGFGIIATTGTAKAINEAGIECESVLKISEGRPNIEDHLKNGEISMVINTSDNRSVKDDTTKIRQSAVRFNVPYITTVAAANAAIEAAKGLQKGELDVKAIQDYLG